MNVMAANLENRVATACIAEALHISVRQLERRFNDALGVSPKKVYTILRLERAHQLLLQTLLPPHEIAVACGSQACRTSQSGIVRCLASCLRECGSGFWLKTFCRIARQL